MAFDTSKLVKVLVKSHGLWILQRPAHLHFQGKLLAREHATKERTGVSWNLLKHQKSKTNGDVDQMSDSVSIRCSSSRLDSKRAAFEEKSLELTDGSRHYSTIGAPAQFHLAHECSFQLQMCLAYSAPTASKIFVCNLCKRRLRVILSLLYLFVLQGYAWTLWDVPKCPESNARSFVGTPAQTRDSRTARAFFGGATLKASTAAVPSCHQSNTCDVKCCEVKWQVL